jgi:hypothetical protein
MPESNGWRDCVGRSVSGRPVLPHRDTKLTIGSVTVKRRMRRRRLSDGGWSDVSMRTTTCRDNGCDIKGGEERVDDYGLDWLAGAGAQEVTPVAGSGREMRGGAI